MDIDVLSRQIKEYDNALDLTISLGNEIHITTTKEKIVTLVDQLLKEFSIRFLAEFARQEKDIFIISILFVSRECPCFVKIDYPTEKELNSLQNIIFQSYLYEREISDLYGISIKNGLDTRPIVKHEKWPKDVFPLRKEFAFGQKIKESNEFSRYPYKEVTGGGHQIFAGPVHAGIIGPGHFRFSAIGEDIENLEVRLMYKHRGIEKLAENVDANNLNLVFERVSGECSVSYGESFALLVEKMLNYTPPKEIQALRVILLELERIYNFLGDIGGICTDVGFSYPAKKFEYFAEIIHQLCERVTGSRFIRNAIIPLGSNIDFTQKDIMDIKETLTSIKVRLTTIFHLATDNVTFLDRTESTGMLDTDAARKFCLTGVVARASGLNTDVRTKFGYEIYPELKEGNHTEIIGGAFERYKIKIEEIKDSFKFIEKATSYIKTDLKRKKTPLNLKEGMEAIVAVETVKGELVVYGQVGKDNKFNRLYFKTPSFTSFHGLAEVVLGEIVPDFPLCNKSFNMSYSENDR
ncbi:Ni,Fe-hydrogenase III large subunit [Desulfonispora thiosulfatigenes DSM 11270]|uniref:Ni,Fe-hydrogenase III large subunit n=1 Tax=Desulfonispora thiosulfatigenes DSM 11270 TaxID=656914 RepID=A0A1W1VBR5_DESTI|nr:NADH-quinone oxidoreductase subunit C [Desulfonispora thiosulfatigenes]SMB90765.1 Ni,Fe-hydrogenase III large subunit [Desulfonispora thiosulfatigenes DSM 11270]